MTVTPDMLTPRQGKVLRYAVMTGVVPNPRFIQINPSIVSDLPRTSMSARLALWQLTQMGLLEKKLVGHKPSEEGKKLLKLAETRKLWLS